MDDETKTPTDPGTPASEDPAAPTISRRDLLRAGVVTAIAVAVPGCGDAALGPDGGIAPGDAARLDGGELPGDDAGPEMLDAGPTVEQVPPPEATPESALFDMGVASGDATATAAILWAHHGGSEPLEVVVWEMDGDDYASTVHVGEAALEGGFAHVEVTGLTAGARYRYAFYEAGRAARSPIGRLRAALADDALEPLVIAAVSCVSNTRDIPTLAHAGARSDLDLFLFLGDSTYNDGAESADEYRAKWSTNLTRPEYRVARGAAGALCTWDDHEFDNDFDPESMPAAQRDAAVAAFFQHQPLRRDAASPDRVWKRMRWGATLEVFVLDCRSERLPSTRRTAGAQYLSRAQMDWLKAGLAESTAVFKLILNSVPISDMPGAFDLQPQDRWEGYAAQRTEILEHIDAAAIPGVLWVAGDFHLASLGKVGVAGAPGATQTEVLVGPGAQTGNPLAAFLNEPQFSFSTTTNNYAVLYLDPVAAEIEVRWVAGDGDVIETTTIALG